MKQCRKCNIELNIIGSRQDGYSYICKKCNDVTYCDSKLGKDEDKIKDAHPTTRLEVNIGNTHLIDIEYDELDKVVERGRD
jgi:hypothetical protein